MKDVCFIDHKTFRQMHIKELKIVKRAHDTLTYVFDDGMLISEPIDGYPGLRYEYKYDTGSELLSGQYLSRQQGVVRLKYKYKTNKLDTVIFMRNDVAPEGFYKFIYGEGGRLDHLISYRINISMDKRTEDSLATLLYKTSSEIDRKELYSRTISRSRLDTFETGVMYYLYEGQIPIGYFATSDDFYYWTGEHEDVDDFFTKEKVQELKETGIERFRKKYLSEEKAQSLIIYKYSRVTEQKQRLDGKPLDQYLQSVGKGNCLFLVMEIAENRFLYYFLMK